MKAISAIAGAALAACAGAVCAQVPTPPSDTIVVTATRAPRTADDTLTAVSVITREDIERRQPLDITELLRTQAGIDITRSGGPGGNVSLFLRGGNSNHVLVLIDGVRVASLTTGTFDWRSLPLEQIERIEIVRGPRASLYGSDAIGGVIQIFTRRAQGIETALGAGTDDTRRASVAAGTRGSTRVFAAGSHFQTDGFSATNPRAGPFFDPDEDGLRRQSVSAGFEADLGAAARLEVIGRQARGTTEIDPGESDIVNESVSARLAHAPTDRWTQTLTVGVFGDSLRTRGPFSSTIRSHRRSLDWQHDLAVGSDTLITAGVSVLEESAVTSDFDREQDSRAAFALWQHRFGDRQLQLSGRYDDYSTFGGHGTWSAAYGWALTPATRAWLSYGTGFRAPSLNDLFHPGVPGLGFAGNPDLEPERSRTAEAGLRRRLAGGYLALSLFSTRFDNLIAFAGVDFQAINVAEASARGAELEHGQSVGDWYFATALTLQRTRDETSDLPLVQRPDAKLATYAERRIGRAALGAEVVAVSERRDVSGEDAPGYAIVNIAGRYGLGSAWMLELRVENLFDKDYEVVRGFNTPGRSAFLTLRYGLERDD
jgi:vitamin B12 transporter